MSSLSARSHKCSYVTTWIYTHTYISLTFCILSDSSVFQETLIFFSLKDSIFYEPFHFLQPYFKLFVNLFMPFSPLKKKKQKSIKKGSSTCFFPNKKLLWQNYNCCLVFAQYLYQTKTEIKLIYNPLRHNVVNFSNLSNIKY